MPARSARILAINDSTDDCHAVWPVEREYSECDGGGKARRVSPPCRPGLSYRRAHASTADNDGVAGLVTPSLGLVALNGDDTIAGCFFLHSPEIGCTGTFPTD